MLWGPVKAGLRCVDCGHVCHDKCADAVPKNCTKYKTVTDNLQTHTLTRSGGDNGSVNSSMNIILSYIFQLFYLLLILLFLNYIFSKL